jgi:hypothetical protein
MICQPGKTDSRVAPMEGLVCTLFEGDYHFGLAALINSLVRFGFQGDIVAGYRGALPPWTDQLKRCGENGRYEVAPGVGIEFLRLDTPVHFTNLKPEFMRKLIGERSGCKRIWYFDPDIVIRAPWTFFEEWVRHGVALCEDVNGAMPANHPIRLRWMELVSPLGLKDAQPLSTYYNGGFIGLPTSCSGFLERWETAMRLAEAEGLDARGFATVDRTNPFHKGDQDAMNIAAMYSEHPLTTLGAEGMDFRYGGVVMHHAIGSPKPWRKKMILSALSGVPPSGSDKAYLAHVTHPIRCYSQPRLAAKRLSCAVGALIGRFYRRR